MKKKILALACCTMLLSISSVALAYGAKGTNGLTEQGQYFSKGDTELGFHGSYNSFRVERSYNSFRADANNKIVRVETDNESENINFYYADLEVSHFLTDNFSVGIDPVWFYIPKIDNFKAYAFGLEGNAQYYFQKINKHFVPYLGVHTGYLYGDAEYNGDSENNNITTYGVQAGFDIPINNNVFFDTQLKWTDYNLPWDDIDLSATQVLLGLKIKL